MHRIQMPLVIVAGLGLAVGVMGCGQVEQDRPPTYPVSGVVTLNGDPVEGATVTFVPQADGQSAVGTTDATGRYTLTTFASGDGALPGSYNVKVVKFEQPAAESTAAGSAGGAEVAIPEDAGYAPPAEEGGETGSSKNVLPEQYGYPSRSGLTAEVVAGENPPQNFELEG